MANDFSDDSNCKALWRFEDGALTADSKGSNTLSIGNTPTADTSIYKEGSASVEIEELDYFSINDADLDAGFPLKSGDTNKKISICFWVRINELPVDNELRMCYRKSTTNKVSFLVYALNDEVKTAFVLQITEDGSSPIMLKHDSGIAINKWYHVAYTYDVSDESYRIRVWDDTAGAILGVDKTGSGIGDIFVGDAFCVIGYPTASNTMFGNLDEMVIFDDVLTVEEIDQIRAGTYGAGAPEQTELDYERKTRGVARGVIQGAA